MRIYRDYNYYRLDVEDEQPSDSTASLSAQKAATLISILEESFTSGITRIIRYGVRPNGTWVGQFANDEGEVYGFLLNPTTMSVETAIATQPRVN